MADGDISNIKAESLKDLEDAGFSHCNGKKIICYNCNLRPRSGGGLSSNPAKLHAELCPNCCYVKENDLAKKFLNEHSASDGACGGNDGGNYTVAGGRPISDNSGNNTRRIDQLPQPHLVDTAPKVGLERFQVLQKRATCMDCSVDFASYVFIPCRHVFCSGCSSRRRSRCIKCRLPIEKIDRFYWV